MINLHLAEHGGVYRPRGRVPQSLLALAQLLLLAGGCSPEFLECYGEWQECKEDCPTPEEEEQIAADAEAWVLDCYDSCPDGGPYTCFIWCWMNYLEMIQEVGCNARCDATFTDCVEAIQPPASPPPQLARSIGGGTYEVERGALAGLLSSPLGALQGASVVPLSLADGNSGFGLAAVAPGTVIAQLGLKQGDVLERIGGAPVSESTWRAEMFDLLHGGVGEVSIQRGSTTLNLRYKLR